MSAMTSNRSVSEMVEPDWLNAETCIENADIAYEDSICDDDGPVDTVISSGDLGVIIGLAKYALNTRASSQAQSDDVVERVVREAILEEHKENGSAASLIQWIEKGNADDQWDARVARRAVRAAIAAWNTRASSQAQSDDVVERVARIIDPNAWAVMDAQLQRMKHKWRGQDVMWDMDRFKHKKSMAKARDILAAIPPAGELERVLRNTAIAIGKLVVAADGIEELRPQRLQALEAMKSAETALNESSAIGGGDGR